MCITLQVNLTAPGVCGENSLDCRDGTGKDQSDMHPDQGAVYRKMGRPA